MENLLSPSSQLESVERVRHLAHLARLALTETEILAFAPQLDTILKHVSELQDVDVMTVAPMLSPLDAGSGHLREDSPRAEAVQKSQSQRVILCAPQSTANSFVVPPVL